VKKKNILFRLDRGKDRVERLEALVGKGEKETWKAYKEGWNIIIKGNMRQEDKETWHGLGKEYGKGKKKREGKKRYTGKVKLDCPINNRYPSVDEVFEVL
jgi:hypothetical protein